MKSNMKIKSIEVEALVAMFVIAMGHAIEEGFAYFPKLPSCFSKGINFSYGCNADLLCLQVSTDLKIKCVFMKEDGETFSYSLGEVMKMKPYLWVAIITHVCDMIENIEI